MARPIALLYQQDEYKSSKVMIKAKKAAGSQSNDRRYSEKPFLIESLYLSER